jgi:hypothetical protein
MIKLKQQRARFTLSTQVTYLNCAYMSPLLKAVEKQGVAGILKKRNPTSVSPKDFFTDTEKLRRNLQNLFRPKLRALSSFLRCRMVWLM